MNVDDIVTVSSGVTAWDGTGRVTEVDPPVTTDEWIWVEYDDGRTGYVPAKYATAEGDT